MILPSFILISNPLSLSVELLQLVFFHSFFFHRFLFLNRIFSYLNFFLPKCSLHPPLSFSNLFLSRFLSQVDHSSESSQLFLLRSYFHWICSKLLSIHLVLSFHFVFSSRISFPWYAVFFSFALAFVRVVLLYFDNSHVHFLRDFFLVQECYVLFVESARCLLISSSK